MGFPNGGCRRLESASFLPFGDQAALTFAASSVCPRSHSSGSFPSGLKEKICGNFLPGSLRVVRIRAPSGLHATQFQVLSVRRVVSPCFDPRASTIPVSDLPSAFSPRNAIRLLSGDQEKFQNSVR